jgi:putative phosphoesterase
VDRHEAAVTLKIGLVGDTHIPEAGADLPDEAYACLAGADQILHCGDLHSLEVVDRLERIGPTRVSRGNGDTRSPRGGRPGVTDDRRIADVVVVQCGRFRVGLTHDLEHTEYLDDGETTEILSRTFEGAVDIAVSGHTHVPLVRALSDGTVLINPGSPTMPYGYLDIVGTIGILLIGDATFEATIVDLATGAAALHIAGPKLGEPAMQRGDRPIGGR